MINIIFIPDTFGSSSTQNFSSRSLRKVLSFQPCPTWHWCWKLFESTFFLICWKLTVAVQLPALCHNFPLKSTEQPSLAGLCGSSVRWHFPFPDAADFLWNNALEHGCRPTTGQPQVKLHKHENMERLARAAENFLTLWHFRVTLS